LKISLLVQSALVASWFASKEGYIISISTQLMHEQYANSDLPGAPFTNMKPTKEEARKLATFLETGQTLAGTYGLKAAISRVLETLGRHHGVMRGVVMLLDHDTSELGIIASHGLDESRVRRIKYRIGEGITGRVVETGKPIVVPQVSREPMFLDRLGVRKLALSRQELAFICVPILVNRKPVGALGVDLPYKADRDYERATSFFSIIATMIAQAIKVDHLIETDKQRLLDENIHLKQELRERYDFSHIIGNSNPLRQVYEQVTQVARTNTTVLLRGESGTGKELIAHAIHYNSLRANKPFIKVSCAALPETLIESELFGYEKGAFTGAQNRKKGRFELAEGGTLFLDEIGDLNTSTQIKLLRVLQEREFERLGGTETIKINVRLVAATNKDLTKAINAGQFREDLYYRLNVFPFLCRPCASASLMCSCWPIISWKSLRANTAKGSNASQRPRSICWRAITGRAMFASWKTSSSARCWFARLASSTAIIFRPHCKLLKSRGPWCAFRSTKQ